MDLKSLNRKPILILPALTIMYKLSHVTNTAYIALHTLHDVASIS